MKTQIDQSRIKGGAGSLLVIVALFGMNSMHGQIYRNGYMRKIADTLSSPTPVLPGSDTPLLTRYTGLLIFDHAFALASILWQTWPDGSAPALSLYMVHFISQLPPLYLVMMIEASRRCNRKSPLILSVFWGLMMQGAGYALNMPMALNKMMGIFNAL